MTTNPQPRRELPNTYFVQDRSNEDELTRLHIQDQVVTAGMGGVLPEQPDPSVFQKVLDVGCGTGDWLIETAKTYPGMTRLVGVDISARMIEYAREQAKVQQVGERVEFEVMDALRMLEFHADSFDLANQRFGAGYLRTWNWRKLLHEYQRVTRAGGVIRVTEFNAVSENNSPALTELGQLLAQALHRAGHFFTPSGDGIISQLPRILAEHGIQNVQTRAYTFKHNADTAEGQLFMKDITIVYRTVSPFIRKWANCSSQDYEMLYQQMLTEMQRSDFYVIWRLLTAWGINAKR